MLIGLIGKKGTGKTTIAKYLEDNHGFKRYSFADPLKEMLVNAGMCTYGELYEEKTDFSRWLMQKIGTDIIRNQVSKSFWVDKPGEKLVRNRDNMVIIDDIRFIDEYLYLKALGHYHKKIFFIRIKRDTGFEDVHVSETELDDVIIHTQYTIMNNGTIEGLLREVNNLFTERLS